MRIVMYSSQFGTDVRAYRAGRYFLDQGHEVSFAFSALPTTHPTTVAEAEPRHGIRTYALRHYENVAAVLDDHLSADVVWCHGLAAMWRYGSSGTYDDDIAEHIHEGKPIAETSWWPKAGRAGLVYDIHEYEPDRPQYLARPHDTADWIERERRSIPIADALVTVSSEIAALTEARRLNPYSVDVVTNAPPRLGRPLRTEEARAALAEKCGLERGRKLLAFAGSPTRDRDLSTLARALSRFDTAIRPLLVFFCGPHHGWKDCGVEPDAVLSAPYGWDPSPNAPLGLLDYLSACDVAWNGAWTEFENWRSGAPNKMYEYAAAGVAQVAPVEMRVFARMNRDNALGLGFSRGAVGAAHAISTVLKTGMRVAPDTRAGMHFEQNAGALDRVLDRAIARRDARATRRIMTASTPSTAESAAR